MSFLKDLVDSFGEIFSTSPSTNNPNSSSTNSPNSDSTMENPAIGNERTAFKLKGYFELAKEEIAKAVRAEEWGLIEDAITHYNSAQRILLEAKDTRPPSYISSSEQEKVKSYHQKIAKWQGQVTDRLQVLSRRTVGSTSTSKTTVVKPKIAAVASKVSTPRKDFVQKPSFSGRNNLTTRNQINNAESPKPIQVSPGAYDPKLVEMINTAIVDKSPSVRWEDVAGLEKAKQSLMEMVILPTKRKDLFTGLRRPARGLLLFGPPGNGKTMLAKAVASESEATFFNVSASSLTSKWVGEAEKLVRTLFMVAISRQPSVIFMDEIDSATNKPQELDDAVLRRLVKRIYVPLPDENVRRLLLKNKLKGQAFSLPGRDIERLVKETDGYSGSDLQALCEEAAMMPIRELGSKILTVKENQVRPLKYEDFRMAMNVIRPSLQRNKWDELEKWNREFGSN
ncbi:Fidgetin-like protein [Thalictrum thalictroides]|uniref:microtubule-severing ATPase n=1 Tax=Thalictrum thalictroides TaxID=46969 RepID=A0A7J6W846_THATH|nr:Fidgetin-like protein [Thalictrum thalictroides]